MTVTEYKSLKGVAEWEIAVTLLGMCDFTASSQYWRLLEKESNWSKVSGCPDIIPRSALIP